MMNLKQMSKVLIPLSFLSFNCGFADGELVDTSLAFANGNPIVADCKPAPAECKPKTCAPCENKNVCQPAFPETCCEVDHWSTSVDYLYWYARETNLEVAGKVKAYPQQSGGTGGLGLYPMFPTEHGFLPAKWDSGVRVGIGYNDKEWDFLASWTGYWNSSHKDVVTAPINHSFPFVTPDTNPTAGESAVFDPYINQAVYSGSTGSTSQSVKSHWNLHFNQADFELGKKCWLSNKFSIRPFAGVRAAWIRTELKLDDYSALPPITAESTLRPGVIITQSADSTTHLKYENKFSGAGLIAGLQPVWQFKKYFAIFANFEGGLLWGQFRGHHRTNDNGSQKVLFNNTNNGQITTDNKDTANSYPKESYNELKMQGVLDLGIGMRWETRFSCDRYRFVFDAGWEHHTWFNFGKRYQTVGSSSDTTYFDGDTGTGVIGAFYNGLSAVISDLGMGGLVLRASFDF